MRIRDDRHPDQEKIGTRENRERYDAVLYNCPQCGRSHFVTVDDCPTADTAAYETAMVDRKAA